MDDAQVQLDGFLAKYDANVGTLARDLLARMRARIPGAWIMVYDNYNALAIGFGPTDKPSKAVLSLAVMPRWVTLCFLFGTALRDPHGLLRGGGSRVRNIRLFEPAMLDDPHIDALVAQAVAQAEPPFDTAGEQRLVIKSVSARQRPRRS